MFSLISHTSSFFVPFCSVEELSVSLKYFIDICEAAFNIFITNYSVMKI